MIFVYSKYTTNENYKILLIVSMILFILLNLHLGCQEIFVENNNPKQLSYCLSFLKKYSEYTGICKYIHNLRYFDIIFF